MFNLLVKSGGWNDRRDTMPSDRVFEFTPEQLEDQFRLGNQLDVDAVKEIPALFMAESAGDSDQIARVGKITMARVQGRDILIEYEIDSHAPTITNEFIESISESLRIDVFEFHRTHWAVKEPDIYQVLMQTVQPRRVQPEIFQLADPESVESDLVSVMMPFGEGFSDVFYAIRETARELDLRCFRVDDIWESHTVLQDIVSLIDRSRVVICDCSDRNPNVFYEIGISHSIGRDVILISQSSQDIPFDLRHLRYVEYLNNGEGISELREKLYDRLQYLIS